MKSESMHKSVFASLLDYLRQSFELLYFAFFIPSQFQQWMNAHFPVILPHKMKRSERRIDTALLHVVQFHSSAQSFWRLVALWWTLQLIPVWFLGWNRLPIWFLVVLSISSIWIAWGVMLLDVTSGIIAPLWIGLAWVLNPILPQAITQASAAMLSSDSLALSIGLGITGGLLGGISCFQISIIYRQVQKKEGPITLSRLLAFVCANWIGLIIAIAIAISMTSGIAGILASIIAVIMLFITVSAGDRIWGDTKGIKSSIPALVIYSSIATVIAASGFVSTLQDEPVFFASCFLVSLLILLQLGYFFNEGRISGIVRALVVAIIMGCSIIVTEGAILQLSAMAPRTWGWWLWFCVFWGLSTRHDLRWLGIVGFGLSTLVWSMQGWQAALFVLLAIVAGGLRLWSSLAAVLASTLAYFILKVSNRQSAIRWLCIIPPFSDEIVWTPVPFLGRLLVRAYEEDPETGLRAIEIVRNSLHHSGAARRALSGITQVTLRQCSSVEEIAEVTSRINWLPENLVALRQDINELVPRFFRIAHRVEIALESSSTHNCRLGLEAAADDLKTLDRDLVLLIGRQPAVRWQPVVATWRYALATELGRPVAASETGVLPNPYWVGTPLRREQHALFRGREMLRDQIVTTLLNQDRVTLVLYGPRRMGKTSFLQQLLNLLTGDVLPVFVDLQSPVTTRDTAAFFFSIARAIGQEARNYHLNVLSVERESFRIGDPFVVFDDWLEETLHCLRGWRVLLMLDEFEKLGEAIAAGRISESLLDYVRHLIQHRSQLTLLFAGVATLEELGPRWSSYFINTRALEVTYLLPEEAESLIRTPNREIDFPLTYDDSVVHDILMLTRCQPALVQLLCSEIVNEANAQKTLHATPAVLEGAIERALTSGGAFYFRNIWDEMTSNDKRSLASGQSLLRAIAAGDRSVTFVADSADAATRRAIDRMVRLHILEPIAGGYQVEVPLVARWVRDYAPRV